MDWSGSMKGKLMEPYMEAIVRATLERAAAAGIHDNTLGTNNAVSMDTMQSYITELAAGNRDDGVFHSYSFQFPVANNNLGVANAVDHIINLIITGGSRLHVACNHTDNSGNWHLLTDDKDDTAPAWGWADILADIGDPARITVKESGYLSAAWLAQTYQVLNRIKWFVGRPQDWHQDNEVPTGTFPTLPEREYNSTLGSPVLATELAHVESTYDSTSDSTHIYDNSTKHEYPRAWTNLQYVDDTTDYYHGWIQSWTARYSLGVPVWTTKDYGLTHDIDMYLRVRGYDEFSPQAESWIDAAGEDLFNQFLTDFTVIPADIPSGIDDSPLDYLNLPVIGSTTRPPDWPTTPALGAGWTKKGWYVDHAVIVRKFDVSGGFAFLA
jgi:hypothetical protein